MFRNLTRRIWKRRRWVIGVSLAAFVALNVMSYLHARAMTHFDQTAARTPKPEHLSAWGKVKVVLTGIHVPRPINAISPAARGWPYETHHFTTSDGVKLEAWYVRSK